jgi:large subunit ribosomal protein L21
MLLFIQVVEDDLMYAVIESGGKQYKVAPGEVVRVEKLSQESGATVEFNKVLAVYNDQQIMVGTPWVQNAKVIGTVSDNGKAKKVIVFKYKRKKQYRVTRGHRQPYTAVKIDEINAS